MLTVISTKAKVTISFTRLNRFFSLSFPPRQPKFASSTLSESGHPRNIPGKILIKFLLSNLIFIILDVCSIRPNPPKDIQVLIRKGDHTGINSLITNMPLQQFRQMIGLQCSSGYTAMNDRRISSSLRTSDNRRPYSSMNPPPLSSSSSSSSSSLTTSNIRLAKGFQHRSQDAVLQQNYSSFPNTDRQHSPMLSITPRMFFLRFKA